MCLRVVDRMTVDDELIMVASVGQRYGNLPRTVYLTLHWMAAEIPMVESTNEVDLLCFGGDVDKIDGLDRWFRGQSG